MITTSHGRADAAGFCFHPQRLQPQRQRSGQRGLATMPLRMPIEVMPTCTVDRKRVGSSCSFTAIAAEVSPSSARRARRARLAITSAISDMANTPFNTISAARSRTSMG